MGNVWTGLHEIDSLDGSKVKWTDCSDLTYYNYHSAPSPVVDGNKCFTVNPTTGQWKAERCDLKLSFICEENLGMNQCMYSLNFHSRSEHIEIFLLSLMFYLYM